MSVRRIENATRPRKVFLLGGCALVLLTLGADKPAPNNIVLEIRGYLVPVRQVAVSPKVAGEVVEMPIEEGQKVKKGDVLARLDRGEFEADLRLARARMNLALAQVDKAKEGGGRDEFNRVAA